MQRMPLTISMEGRSREDNLGVIGIRGRGGRDEGHPEVMVSKGWSSREQWCMVSTIIHFLPDTLPIPMIHMPLPIIHHHLLHLQMSGRERSNPVTRDPNYREPPYERRSEGAGNQGEEARETCLLGMKGSPLGMHLINNYDPRTFYASALGDCKLGMMMIVLYWDYQCRGAIVVTVIPMD